MVLRRGEGPPGPGPVAEATSNNEAGACSHVRLDRSRTVIALLVVAIVISGALVTWGYYTNPRRPATPSYPTTTAELTPTAGAIPRTLGADFLGINLRATFAMQGAQGSAVAASGVHLVRWPGGDLGDRLDPLALNGTGLVYGGPGAPLPPATTAAEFVAWCKSVSCSAIVTLPGEIDNPSFASQEVGYFVQTLAFRPAYWEVGNEPDLWTHFGVAWADWAPGQTLGTDPTQYAQEVASYISAIRSVDPTTPIIGLPGVGVGGFGEESWVQATVQANGPNLSAVAIHVYPIAANLTGVGLAELFGDLNNSNGIPSRVAAAEATVAATCASCRLQVLIEEAGVASGATANTSAGFPWVTFEAAELVQAIESGSGGLAYWAAQGSYPGAWLSSNGAVQPTYTLVASLLNPLPATWEPTTLSSTLGGLYAVGLGGSASAPSVVVFVNANATWAVRANLTGLVGYAPSGAAVTWSNSTSAPVATSPMIGTTDTWFVPPDGLLAWRAVPALPTAASHALGAPAPAAGPIALSTGAAARGGSWSSAGPADGSAGGFAMARPLAASTPGRS